MKDVNRVRWLSKFDMEPLLGFILTAGMLISIGLMASSWAIAQLITRTNPGDKIRASSIPQLLQADLHRFGSPDFWVRFLADLGFSVLLITPYSRLVVTWLYLGFIKHRWRYAVYASIILVLLGIDLFSDFVLVPGFNYPALQRFFSR